MEFLLNYGIFFTLLIIGYFFGKFLERRHYKSIRQREQALLHIPAVTFERNYPFDGEVARCELSVGSVVVSIDYFKRFLTGWRKLFGGELKSYASIIDRGRREALLRMKESSPGADAFINCRLETSSITKGKKNAVSCSEIIAYGTAIYYK